MGEAVLRANVRRHCAVVEMAELKKRVERLSGREGVRLPRARLRSEALLWEEVRLAMRAERSRRSREDLAPMTRADVAEARGRIEEAGDRFAAQGEWAEAIWEKAARRFEAHREFLWVEVPGLDVVIRSTVALERAHAADRRGVRHRRDQEATGEEMSHLGALPAFWSNARCPWFVEHVLTGVIVWEPFARQDPEEVRQRLPALPRRDDGRGWRFLEGRPGNGWRRS